MRKTDPYSNVATTTVIKRTKRKLGAPEILAAPFKKKELSERDKHRMQGYGCACAIMAKNWGMHEGLELLKEGGFDLNDMKEAGCDQNDIESMQG